MELKGHNLIIISLDSHFSKMERNVLTHHPSHGSPHLPGSCGIAREDSDGLQQLSATRATGHSHHALCPRRKLGAVAGDLSANASQIKFAILGSLVKTTLLSVWLLTAGGVKSSTQYKPRPAEPCPAQDPRHPLGCKGFENVLMFSSLFIFQCLMILSMQGAKTQFLLTIKEAF